MLDIRQKLKDNSVLIENALYQYMNSSQSHSSVLADAQAYSLLGGGKRIRAFLVMKTAELLGADTQEAALPYACAIEMIHASSLIHDDMPCMDNDEMRRGKPSTHVAFGETAALLSGDALMMKAFVTVTGNPHLKPEINAMAAHVLAEASGEDGMLGGQAIDTLSESKVSSLDELVKLHQFKTGKLIIASATLGCYAAQRIDNNDDNVKAAITYADRVGLAFQIVDDILDYKEGKKEDNSFLSFMTIEEAEKYVNQLTEEAIEAVEQFDDGSLSHLARYLTNRDH